MQNIANLSNLYKKTNKQCTQALQKIRQAGKYAYKAKMRKRKQINQLTVICHAYQKRRKIHIVQDVKKCNTNLVIVTSKTITITQRKHTTPRNNACKKMQSPSPASMSAKIHHIGLQGKSKPDQQLQHEYFEKTKLSSKNF